MDPTTLNPLQQQVLSPTTNASTPRKTASKLYVFVAVGMLVCGLVLGFFFVKLQSPSSPASVQTTTNTPAPTPNPTPDTSWKFLFDKSSEFAFGKKWPTSLVNYPQSSLIPLTCSDLFFKGSDGTFSTGFGDGRDYPLTDERTLAFLAKNSEVTNLMWCETPTKARIMIYEVQGGGGGSLNTAYAGYLDGINHTVLNKSSISNNGWPYFTCTNPLGLNHENYFFLQCGGGDGGFGGSAIYTVNLDKSEVVLHYYCTSTSVDGGSPQVSCR